MLSDSCSNYELLELYASAKYFSTSLTLHSSQSLPSLNRSHFSTHLGASFFLYSQYHDYVRSFDHFKEVHITVHFPILCTL